MLVPDLTCKQETYESPPHAVLIIDGCTCHDSDVFLDLCLDHGIIPIFLPPHTSHMTQPLDLGIFGVQKRYSKYEKGDDDLATITNQIKRILNSWHKATTPENIVSAFRAAGITVFLNNDELFLRAKVDLSRSIHFKEMDLDVSELESLSDYADIDSLIEHEEQEESEKQIEKKVEELKDKRQINEKQEKKMMSTIKRMKIRQYK